MATTGDPIICAGCGAYNNQYLCQACQHEMNSYVASTKSSFDAMMREDAQRSAGGPMSERMRDLEASNKDLRSSIRELKEWAQENGDNSYNVQSCRNMCKEVVEHCAVALDPNPVPAGTTTYHGNRCTCFDCLRE